ncbi:hypothetical protein [Anaerosporobacter faecicola]|uniref:hypothetical protein n=1 Tax=Anaerosporobacter faecicola TaxID=2718714 RepID=UPI00143938D8|nr:hypothetical protein [Anaerosporobacter faecicola]
MHRSLNVTRHDLLVKTCPSISKEDLFHKHQFISSYQKATLYSLFAQNKITKKQYEKSLETLSTE